MSPFSDLDLQCENHPSVPASGEEQCPSRHHGRGPFGKEQVGGPDKTFLGAPEKRKGKFQLSVAGLYVHRMSINVDLAPINICIFFLSFMCIYLFPYFFLTVLWLKKRKLQLLENLLAVTFCILVMMLVTEIPCVCTCVRDQRSAGSEGQWKESAGLLREPDIVSTVALRCLAFHTSVQNCFLSYLMTQI